MASRVELLEASAETLEAMSARVARLEASEIELKTRVGHLERDRNFWRKFMLGLWKVFNGGSVEAMARPCTCRDQQGDFSWEPPASSSSEIPMAGELPHRNWEEISALEAAAREAALNCLETESAAVPPSDISGSMAE